MRTRTLIERWARDGSLASAWGVLDLLALGTYLILSIANGTTPFLNFLQDGRANAEIYEHQAWIAVGWIAALHKASCLLSGWWLVKRRRIGGMLALIQEPFRLGLASPSLFFLAWLTPLLSDLFQTSAVPAAALLGPVVLLLSELARTATIVYWLRHQRNEGGSRAATTSTAPHR